MWEGIYQRADNNILDKKVCDKKSFISRLPQKYIEELSNLDEVCWRRLPRENDL